MGYLIKHIVLVVVVIIAGFTARASAQFVVDHFSILPLNGHVTGAYESHAVLPAIDSPPMELPISYSNAFVSFESVDRTPALVGSLRFHLEDTR